MNSIKALASISNEITVKDVRQDIYVITEFLDYLRWLADQDTGANIRTGQVWELYYEGVRQGRAWSELCESLGLPVRYHW